MPKMSNNWAPIVLANKLYPEGYWEERALQSVTLRVNKRAHALLAASTDPLDKHLLAQYALALANCSTRKANSTKP